MTTRDKKKCPKCDETMKDVAIFYVGEWVALDDWGYCHHHNFRKAVK